MPISKCCPEETYKYFHSTESLKSVARRLGVNSYTLRTWWLVKFGKEALDSRSADNLRGSKVSLDEIKLAFHTTEPFKTVAARFKMSPNTLRTHWVYCFGQEAFNTRGKESHSKAGTRTGLAGKGKPKNIRKTSYPCAICGVDVVLNALQLATTKRVICQSCEEIERGVDRHCPVCGFGCVGVKGLAGHMTRPQVGDPEAHAEYIQKQSEALWLGKLEGRDYVMCQECGFKGVFLGNHIKLHLLSAKEYKKKHPGCELRSSISEEARVRTLSKFAISRAYTWTIEGLSRFMDDQGRVVVAEAAVHLGAAVTTVLGHCRSLKLPTRNKLAWQLRVVEKASQFLGEPYIWEWSDPRISNPETNRAYNFDGFFAQSKVIVEAHGDQHFRYSESWHGSLENFHKLRERDKTKKLLAEGLGYKVLVVRPGDPIENKDFWPDLLAGTYPSNGVPLEDILDQLKLTGFPVIEPQQVELRKALTRLASMSVYADKAGVIHPYSTQGTQACSSFFPHRYKAKHKNSQSAWEAWHEDGSLTKAIQLQLDSGHPTTPLRVLRALVMYHRAPSVFRPAVAKFIYETYAENGVTWDPCAGYGGRLLGAVSAGVAKYIGTDIEPETVRGNNLLAESIDCSDRFQVVNVPAEKFDPCIDLDLVFTSPPYFDLEIYGSASGGMTKVYQSARGWVQEFLEPVMRTAFRRLKSTGHLVLNLPNKPIQGVRLDLEAKVLAKAMGFQEASSVWLPVRTFKGQFKSEPILVWSK